MKIKFSIICLTGVLVAMAGASLSFVQPPAISKIGSPWQVTFTVSESTDVEVCIVDMRDSTVIRHLAAGVLGNNAPAPLIASSLSQTLNWDGKDDLGNVAEVEDADISVRVRAGMGVALEKMVGGSPYAFKGQGLGNYCFNGLATSPDGFLYVFGSGGALSEMTLRQYDGSGNYLKTVFPYPAGMAAADISAFGINNWVDGKYSPKAVRISGPIISSMPAADANSKLLSAGANGELCIGKLNLFVLNSNSSATSLPFRLITSPSYQDDQYNGAGPFYLINSKDTNTLLLGGYYQGIMNSGTLVTAPDTGFWRDGAVLKINRQTGVATRLISLDSVPVTVAARSAWIGGDRSMSAIHGIAEDNAGRIYICDRFHRRIGVYDAAGAYLGGIPVDYPENVAVNESGEIYVVTRYESPQWHVGLIKLNKYASFQSGGAMISTLQLTTVLGDYSRDRPFLGIGKALDKSVVWVGYVTFGVRGYRDDGSAFTLIKDFYAENAGVNTGFDRITLDRSTETAYLGDSWNRIYKISDWSNPVLIPCSTSTKKPLLAADLTISPDRKLYVREDRLPSMGGGWSGPLTRYSLDYYHAPLNYSNTASNEIIPITERYGQGYPGRDIAVSAQGKIGFITEKTFGEFVVGTCDDTGSIFDGNARFLMPDKFDTAIYPLSGNYTFVGGIRFDLQGNLYVGSNLRSAGHVVPAGFASDPGYEEAVGSVIKFSAGARGSINGSTAATRVVQGAEKVYSTGFAPFSGVPGHTCICRNPHFDVDAFGRLFIPNAITNKVSVIDNNGNAIVQFGDYGNRDSEGPGSLVPDPAIPMAWPVGAAASDNFIYVTDMINARLVRVRMTYVLDNIPGIGAPSGVSDRSLATIHESPLRLTASPNPSNPVTRISFQTAQASDIRLYVVDVTGGLVKTLVRGRMEAGVHSYVWNGTDNRGAAASAGLYIMKLSVGQRTITGKIILTR